MSKKQCFKCKQLKPLSAFYKNKKAKDGLYGYCKKCTRIYQIETDRKEYYRKYFRKLRSNLKYRFVCSVKCSISASLRGKKAGRKWESLVGYTLKDLIKHLELLFDENMSWNNYGSYWEIDHIIPKSFYIFQTAEDVGFKMCWGLENLQPLEKSANRRKNNKL